MRMLQEQHAPGKTAEPWKSTEKDVQFWHPTHTPTNLSVDTAVETVLRKQQMSSRSQSPGATGSKSAFEQPKSKFKMAHESFRIRMFQEQYGFERQNTVNNWMIVQEEPGGSSVVVHAPLEEEFWRNETTDKKFSTPSMFQVSRRESSGSLVAPVSMSRSTSSRMDYLGANMPSNMMSRRRSMRDAMMEIESGDWNYHQKALILHQQPPPTALLVPPATLGGLSALGAMMDSLGATAVAEISGKLASSNQRPNLDSLLSSLGRQSQQQESSESGSGSPEVLTENVPESGEDEPKSPGLLDILGSAPSSEKKSQENSPPNNQSIAQKISSSSEESSSSSESDEDSPWGSFGGPGGMPNMPPPPVYITYLSHSRDLEPIT
uniref:Uncharacterized protein n=1 Tax=Ditylenchus dipsaci TaxID=166011 RepID=A0A915D6B8_9BILA